MAEVYDGFISYSHAADDLLAPRLQSALQRFAKPWWKRRAVRIFRDESSLSANPHLWSSITEALDSSGWFVLLLSPDAAASEWVNQEIAYWVENRDPKKILPVVTDGAFGWDGEVTGDAVPAALRGVFTEEPRRVDLRFARGEDQLDLQSPEFASAVADIASAIRGIPKDDLASEEVKQHRRTVRTAWAAGSLVTVLAIAAVGFGIQSARNAGEARVNAEAEAEARAAAEANALLAEEQAAIAAKNADLAFSRELAASAVSVLDTDPELSVLLGLASFAAIPLGEEAPVESVVALRQAIRRHTLVDRTVIAGDVPESGFRFGDVVPAFAALSPDGSRYAWFSEVETVHLFDASSWEEMWVREAANESGVWFSADGSYLGYGVSADDSGPARVVFVETESGELVDEVLFEGCDRVNLWGQSPTDGVWAVSVPSEFDCGQGDAEAPRVVLLDGFSVISDLELEVDEIFNLLWVTDGQMVVDDAFTLWRMDPRTGEVFVEATQAGFFWSLTVSPDGRLLAGAQVPSFEVIRVYDAETLQQTDILTGIPFSAEGITFSEDGSFVFAGSRGDVAFGWSLETGKPVHTMAATGKGLDVEFDDDLELLYLMGPREVSRWDLSGRSEVLGLATGVSSNGNDLDADGGTVAWYGGSPDFEQDIIGVFDSETRELGPLLRAHMVTRPAVLPDGRIVLMQGHDRDTDSGAEVAGPVVVWDPLSGETTPLAGCRATIADSLHRNPEAMCLTEGEEWIPAIGFHLDPERETLLVESLDGEWLLFDVASHELLSRTAVDAERGVELYGGPWVIVGDEARGVFGVGSFLTVVNADTFEDIAELPGTMVALSDDGALLALHSEPGRVTLYDTETWQPLREFGAGESRIRGLTFSPDVSLVLSAGSDGFVRIWDVATGAEVHRLPVESPADGAWIDDNHVVVVSRDRLEVFTLDVNELLGIAGDRLIRGLTSDECAIYRIDPCPTLEELRGG